MPRPILWLERRATVMAPGNHHQTSFDGIQQLPVPALYTKEQLTTAPLAVAAKLTPRRKLLAALSICNRKPSQSKANPANQA